MKQKNFYFYTNIFAWGLIILLTANYVFGWTTPSATPPAGNITLQTGATPAGSTGYIQFNDADALGADSNLFWDNTNKYLGIGTTTPAYTFDLVGTGRFTGDITGSAFYYSSDERLKENVQKIDNPLEKIIKLDGIFFNWKETGKKSIGLIAQDVEKIFPQIVKTDENSGMKSIEYAKLIAPLIEAIKEQQKMIDEQKELINKQGEEIKELKVLFGQL